MAGRHVKEKHPKEESEAEAAAASETSGLDDAAYVDPFAAAEARTDPLTDAPLDDLGPEGSRA